MDQCFIKPIFFTDKMIMKKPEYIYRIVKNGRIVHKGFRTEEEAREWGVWNYKGDEKFDVVHIEEIKEREEMKKANRLFLKTPPEKLVINGHTYQRIS